MPSECSCFGCPQVKDRIAALKAERDHEREKANSLKDELNALGQEWPGELRVAVEYLEHGNLLAFRDARGREWPGWAIKQVCRAVRQQHAEAERLQAALADWHREHPACGVTRKQVFTGAKAAYSAGWADGIRKGMDCQPSRGVNPFLQAIGQEPHEDGPCWPENAVIGCKMPEWAGEPGSDRPQEPPEGEAWDTVDQWREWCCKARDERDAANERAEEDTPWPDSWSREGLVAMLDAALENCTLMEGERNDALRERDAANERAEGLAESVVEWYEAWGLEMAGRKDAEAEVAGYQTAMLALHGEIERLRGRRDKAEVEVERLKAREVTERDVTLIFDYASAWYHATNDHDKRHEIGRAAARAKFRELMASKPPTPGPPRCGCPASVRTNEDPSAPCDCRAATWFPDEKDDDGKPLCCIVLDTLCYEPYQQEVELWRYEGDVCPNCHRKLVAPEVPHGVPQGESG